MVFYLWEKPEFAFQIQIEENLTLGRWTLVFYWLISYTIDMELINQACDWFECLKTRRINLINVNQNKLCICDVLWAQTGGRPMHWKSFVFYQSKVFWSHQFIFDLWHWIVHLICGYTRKIFMMLYRYSFLLVAREPENNKKKEIKERGYETTKWVD